MLSLLFGAIPALLQSISGSFNRYQERKQAEHEVFLARERTRRDIALKAIEKGFELGKIQIRATGRIFKYFTFFMWFGPFMISTVFPSYGMIIFENLNQLPEWYVQSCMVIMFAIWGIQSGKIAIANIFSGLNSFFRERQKVIIHRKMFFDVLRSTKGNLSQYEVEIYDKALNSILGKSKE